MREREYLKTRYAAMLSSIGTILLIAAGIMLTPLVIILGHPDELSHARAFLVPAACLAFMGYGAKKGFRSLVEDPLSVREGGIIVVLGWGLVIVFSAWPLMEIMGIPFSRAVFESMSGWTTTGLSVLDVSKTGPTILLWRGIMQLAGGAGLAIIMMSAITGPTGTGISSAEGRGDQLVPNVRQSARLVLIVYAGYAIAGVLLYRLSGMSTFDAINHSFAAVSTGGFSTHVESIGYWDSVTIEAVTLVLMVLGNMSFLTAWLLWRGRFRFVFRNGEIRLQAVLIPFSVAVVFFFTCRPMYSHVGKAFRVALFETISALTTTGFSTVGYGDWNGTGVFMLIALMLIGGGTCSTAGGIKQFRVYFMWRQFAWELQRSLLPRTAIIARPMWEGDRQVLVGEDRIRDVAIFLWVYMALYAIGVLILCACGYPLRDSLFEFASSLGTVGLSIGVTSADMPDIALWTETVAMFLGRLEIIVVMVGLLKLGKDAGRLLATNLGRGGA